MRFSDCPQDRDLTILLAMEQPLAREYAAALLRSEGYNVFATSKGETAISISQKTAGEIDLLITDAQIDSINGFQLAHEILQQRPTTKILMMSKVPVLENAAAHRGFGFLRKPFSAVVFKRRVREVLASDNPAAQSAEAYPSVG
jgi:DNA-binding response OmpR family regulator